MTVKADRRTWLQFVSGGAMAAAFPASIRKALAIPACQRTGTIADVEHIVILMQENRSFDHFFGTMRGVRGYGDPHAVKLPSGEPVWKQPNGSGHVLPFYPTAANLGLQFLEDLPHGWTDTHKAWNDGKYDQWVPAKGTTTMAYLDRHDIPFHYALADAFTVCDAYHCSFLGATDPNRYHMWTGWVGNDGKNGGPVLDNSEAGYDWSTYPERLQKAGISWKIYQDVGQGLDAAHYWGWGPPYVGNYGDNSLLYFHQYQNAPDGSPLALGARTGTNVGAGGTLFDQFKQDVQSGKLPQVSWIVAPEAYSEHPNWPANYGAWYVSQMLDALTDCPDVWSKTAFFLMYDENDGFFDHVVPPTPPQSRAGGLSTVDTTNEVFAGNATYAPGPYGLGVRVPLIAISPWSKGGWVSSEVFDHTSLIQFIEKRFAAGHPGLIESNITRWRRAVTGDLTSLFNFRNPNDAVVPLPSTAGYVPPDNVTHPDYIPDVPTSQALPAQEPGVRPARPVPYELHTHGEVNFGAATVALTFANTGKAAAVFHVRSAAPSGNGDGPWTYTTGAGDLLSDTWSFSGGQSAYDLSVYGPNGFLRTFKGNLRNHRRNDLSLRVHYHPETGGLTLEVHNGGFANSNIQVANAYTRQTTNHSLNPGETLRLPFPLEASFGWYDLTVHADGEPSFERRMAGHVETGHDGVSDPALGRP